jgi:small-conductance mechanosensitive channel
MRDLDPNDLGLLLSVFAVLLIFFGIDFHISRTDAARHRRRAVLFAVISVIGEATAALALVLTWVAIFLPLEAQSIDTLLVFVPGSIAMLCAVVLTGEVVTMRLLALSRNEDADAP